MSVPSYMVLGEGSNGHVSFVLLQECQPNTQFSLEQLPFLSPDCSTEFSVQRLFNLHIAVCWKGAPGSSCFENWQKSHFLHSYSLSWGLFIRDSDILSFWRVLLESGELWLDSLFPNLTAQLCGWWGLASQHHLLFLISLKVSKTLQGFTIWSWRNNDFLCPGDQKGDRKPGWFEIFFFFFFRAFPFQGNWLRTPAFVLH